MKPESKKVHGLDFMFAVACYIQSSSLLSSFFVSITRQDSWIIVLFALIICCPLAWIYCKPCTENIWADFSADCMYCSFSF